MYAALDTPLTLTHANLGSSICPQLAGFASLETSDCRAFEGREGYNLFTIDL